MLSKSPSWALSLSLCLFLYLTLYLFLAFFLILTLSLSLGDNRVTVGRHCHPFFPFMGEADAPARECSMCSSADLLHQTCIQEEKKFRLESSGSEGMASGNTTSSPSPFTGDRKPFPFLRKKNPPPHVRRGSESVCSDSGLFR